MAKKKISGLPAGSALNGTELVPIVQTGTTKRITTQDIANLGNSSGVEGSGTINTLAKFTASSTIGNSIISDNGTIATIAGQLVANGADYHSLKVADGGAQLRLERTGSGAGLMYLGADSFGFKVFDSSFTNRFFVGNTGSVGIGTTSPSTKFHIQDTNGGIFFDGSGATYNRFKSTTSSASTGRDLLFSTQNAGTTPDLYITSAGNLGLGTTNPLGILHLYKAGATTRMVIDGDAAQSRIITYRTGGVQRFGLYVNNTAESGANAGSDFAFRAYNDAGTLLSTPLFIKRSSGNVGINTTSPTSKLQITNTSAGAATVGAFLVNESTTSSTEIRLAFAANTNADIASDRYSYISAINTSGSNGQALKFATNAPGAGAVEAMRIKSNGVINISNIPTSAVGLSAGDIYSNLGILTIV